MVWGLGFRNLENFNKARVLQNPASLAAKFLKVKYFPSGSIIDAKLINIPSYMWRSIWFAKNLLKEMLIWRVGFGEQIKIFKDKWITQEVLCMAHTQGMRLFEDVVVADIIDRDTRWWNTSFLTKEFGANIIAIIG